MSKLIDWAVAVVIAIVCMVIGWFARSLYEARKRNKIINKVAKEAAEGTLYGGKAK